jgi:hypothetical protein
MASCPKCEAKVPAHTTVCSACGTAIVAHRAHGFLNTIYSHLPHSHIEHRKKNAPKTASDQRKPMGPIGRFNTFLGLKIANVVGTMWCAYVFAALALVSLPEAIKGGTAPLIA